MEPLIVVFASLMNKKEDPVVETWNRSTKNNVSLLLNVKLLSVVVIYLVLVKNETNKTKPHV
jgi:hypothetical protein